MTKPLITFLIALSGAAVALGQQPLSLSDIQSQALTRNPSVLIAQQRVIEARARVREVRGQGSPGVVLGVSGGPTHGILSDPASTDNYHSEQATLTFGIPNSPRVKALIAQAEGQLAAVKAQLTRTQLDISFRSSSAYYEVLRAKGGVEIAQANLDQANRQLADTQRRVDLGDVPAADLLKVQVTASQAKVALQRAKSAYRMAVQTLNNLIVRNLDEDPNLSPDETSTQVPSREEAVRAAMASSPDVLEAAANVAAASSNVGAIKHSNDPEFSLQGSYNKTTDPTTYSTLTSVMLSLTLPVYDGGIFSRQVAQAKSQLLQAQGNLDLAKQSVQLQTEQAYLDLLSDMAALEGQKETLSIAQQSYDKARQAYEAGLTTTRDVLDAQLALAQSKIDVANARFDVGIARARLQQLMGITTP